MSQRLKEAFHTHSTRIAFLSPEVEITYGELELSARAMAFTLLQNSDSRKGIAIWEPNKERALEMILGATLAGLPFVLFDPFQKKETIEQILEDIQPSLLVWATEKPPCYLNDQLPSLSLAKLKVGDIIDSQSDKAVYYTSHADPYGRMLTTEIRSEGICNLVESYQMRYQLSPNDRGGIYHRIASGRFPFEIFLYLLSGSSFSFFPEEQKGNEDLLFDWIEGEKISLIHLPTCITERLLEKKWSKPSPLRFVYSFGGGLTHHPIKEYPFSLVSQYGPDENTFVTFETIVSVTKSDERIPLGDLVKHCKATILNDSLQEVCPGEVGELCVGGLGLAEGYLEKFLNAPDEKTPFIVHASLGKRSTPLFMTGDLAKKQEDGSIELLGKKSQQIMQGNKRVEMIVVETVLNNHPGVFQAVLNVIDSPDGKVLGGWWVRKKGADINKRELKKYLRSKLPTYMLPKHLVEMAEFPITADGQISLKELPLPQFEQEDTETIPLSPIERHLVKHYEGSLGIRPVHLTKEVFDLTRDPALCFTLFQTIQEGIGKDLTLEEFLSHSSVRSLADFLIRPPKSDHQNDLIVLQGKGTRSPLLCLFQGKASLIMYAFLAKLVSDRPVYALDLDKIKESQGVDDCCLSLLEMIGTISQKGAIQLLGEGIGGCLSYEIARRYKLISFVGVIDTEAPGKRMEFKRWWKGCQIIWKFFSQNREEKVLSLIHFLSSIEKTGELIFSFKTKKDHSLKKIKKSLSLDRLVQSNIELTIFKCRERGEEGTSDCCMGWQEATSRLVIKKLDDGHTPLLSEKSLKVIAGSINEVP